MLDWLKYIAALLGALAGEALQMGAYFADFFRQIPHIFATVTGYIALVPAWLSVPCGVLKANEKSP